MGSQAVEIIETERVLEVTWSLNRSRVLQRLMLLLKPYEGRYDILPSLEFEVNTHRFTPDLALVPQQPYDWEADVFAAPFRRLRLLIFCRPRRRWMQ